MVMTTDWLALARLAHPHLPDDQVSRYAHIMEALAATFQPAVSQLTLADQPAVVFLPEVSA